MKSLLSKIWSDDFSKVLLTQFFDKEVKRTSHQITLKSLSDMRKIYLGFERSDFDNRMLKSIAKADEAYLGKLLMYYLLALDWLSSEDAPQLREDLRPRLERLIDSQKSLFGNERECFLHRLNVHLTTFMGEFLEDRHLVQLIHFRAHDFGNIVAFLGNCVCEFRGLVYLNSKIEKDVRFLRFLLRFDYKFGEHVDVHVLIRFLSCVLRKEYHFMCRLLTGFREGAAGVKNPTLLMEFYDCYSEFKAITRLLREVHSDFGDYFQSAHIAPVRLLQVDLAAESELEKTLFAIRESSRERLAETKTSDDRWSDQRSHSRARLVHALARGRPGHAPRHQAGDGGHLQRAQRVPRQGAQVPELLPAPGRQDAGAMARTEQ